MEPSTPYMSPRELKCPGAPMKKPIQIIVTPSSSPRLQIECPGAPKKKLRCNGCYLFETGTGGENQEAHMEDNGCLSSY